MSCATIMEKDDLFQGVENERNLEKLGERLQTILRDLNDFRRPLRVLAMQSSPRGDQDVEKQKWVIIQMTRFRKLCVKLLAKKARTQCFVLRLALQLFEEEAELLGQFPSSLFREILAAPLHSNWNSYVVGLLVDEYAALLDVRYGLLSFIEYEAKRLPSPEVYLRLFEILKLIPKPPKRGSRDHEAGDSLTSPPLDPKQLPRIYEKAWISLLAVTPKEHIKETLRCLPEEVFPWLVNPLILADFYLRAFQDPRLDVSIVSLSGLFYLLTRSRLADTQVIDSVNDSFYVKLYSLLTPELLLLDSGRFRRLFVQALQSAMLPATYAAAFAKKALLVAVRAQDVSSILWLLSVAYQLMKTEPEVSRSLIHREKEEAPLVDPFSLDLTLPEAAGVLPSTSAWELETLKRHWAPQVSRMATLFDSPKIFMMGTANIDPDAFVDSDWSQRWSQEQKHKRRKLEKIDPSFAFATAPCAPAIEQIYQLAFDEAALAVA
eukprot:GEMP01021747.1.p1 GENE.GEMP01021747.1~~GEMP01021747.1.p1  ORF type:complete len:491 (+),score=119.56 GEMP01021747.1:192-1664(+)